MASLSRFYGMPVAAEIANARDETLTDQDTDDLFTAHLSRNHGYFGALDKTLSGFVLLDNTGDDAWLVDMRDTGAVYFQDHEERAFACRFTTFGDYRAWKKERAAAGDDDAKAEAVDAHYAAEAAPPSKRQTSTAALATRLQWAVWFFSQPAGRDLGTDSENRDTRSGIGWFQQEIGDDPWAKLREELPFLHDDPHLTCSWLLVAGALADAQMHADIVSAGPKGNPLVDACARAFDGLAIDAALAVLPPFARRKSALLFDLALGGGPTGAQTFVLLARAIAACPTEKPLERFRVCHGLLSHTERADALRADDRARLGALVDTLPDVPARAVLRALATTHDAKGPHPEAAAALALAADTALGSLDERTVLFMVLVGACADDAVALTAARALLEEDRFHYSVLGHAGRLAAAQHAADAAALADRLARITRVRPLYLRCEKKAADAVVHSVLDEAAALPADDHLLLVQRVLASPTGFHPRLIAHCFARAFATPYEGRAADWARSLGALGMHAAEEALAAQRTAFPEPPDDIVTDLNALLALPIPVKGPPLIQQSVREDLAKVITAWLAARQSPEALDELLARLHNGGPTEQETIVKTALNPFDANNVLARLTPAQATRAAEALIALQRTQKATNRGLYNAAGHQLFRFSLTGAEDVLIAALNSETDPDIAANLYAAVRGLKTPRSRAAIVERLFSETRSFWRLANALSEIFDDALEADIVATLTARKDSDGAVGASRYAAALVEHIKLSAPLVRLGHLVRNWQPQDSDARGRLMVVLTEAGAAALRNNALDDARTLLDAAAAYTDAPVSDYYSVDRKRAWANPFEADAALGKRRDKLLAGALHRARASLEKKTARARKSGVPLLSITDAALGVLAQTQVATRLWHDPERGTVWALSRENGFVFFDGFGVTAPAFAVHPGAQLATLAHGETAIAERATFFTADGNRLLDVVRCGARVFVATGLNNGALTAFTMVWGGAREAAVAAAAEAVARMRRLTPRGLVECEPWYLARQGAITRIVVHAPPANKGDGDGRVYLQAPEPEDVAAVEARAFAVMQQPDAQLMKVEWIARNKRRAEQTVLAELQVLAQRREVSGADAARTARAMKERVVTAGFADCVDVVMEPAQGGAPAPAVAALALDDKVAEGVASLYGACHRVRVQVGAQWAELVPLADVRAPTDVICRRGGGVNFTDVTAAQLGKMGYLGSGGGIAWMLNAFIPTAVAALHPEAALRLCGAVPGADVERTTLQKAKGSSTAVFEVMLDPTHAYFWTREGRAGGKHSTQTVLARDAQDAREQVTALLNKRRKQGFSEG